MVKKLFNSGVAEWGSEGIIIGIYLEYIIYMTIAALVSDGGRMMLLFNRIHQSLDKGSILLKRRSTLSFFTNKSQILLSRHWILYYFKGCNKFGIPPMEGIPQKSKETILYLRSIEYRQV